MQTFNIDEVKTQLSQLVDLTAKGESFIVAKAGKSMVKVTALNTPETLQMKQRGFLKGQIWVPSDFDC